MHIADLTAEHESLFFVCLEDWSDQAREGGTRRAQWYTRMEPLGLRAKLAADDSGNVGGMIQYLPVERSFVAGTGLYFVLCVWVHGHREGRGDFQGHGMGTALLDAAEKDARELGAEGMAAWGLWIPFWMRASWFRKRGYRKADRQGTATLVWKPFSPGAKRPAWRRPVRRPLPRDPGKVTVTAFTNGWCMAQNLVYARAKRAASEFGDAVCFHEIDTCDPVTVAKYGLTDALFIDGRRVRTGPPPSYERICGLIARRVARL